MKSDTITLDTTDAPWSDDEIEVTVTEPSYFQKMRIVSNTPPEIQGADPSSISHIPPGTDKFVKVLIDECSDLPIELLTELPEDAMNELILSCSAVLRGKDPSYRPNIGDDDVEHGLDLNDDGTVDLDEYR